MKMRVALLFALLLAFMAAHACFPAIECRSNDDCSGGTICVATVCRRCPIEGLCEADNTTKDAQADDGEQPFEVVTSDVRPDMPMRITDASEGGVNEKRSEPLVQEGPAEQPIEQSIEQQPSPSCYPTKLIFNRAMRPLPVPTFVSAKEIALINALDVEIWDYTSSGNGKKLRVLDKSALAKVIKGGPHVKAPYTFLAFHARSSTLYASHVSGFISTWKRSGNQWGQQQLLYGETTRKKHALLAIKAIAIQAKDDPLLAVGTSEGQVFLLRVAMPDKSPVVLGGPDSQVHAYRKSDGEGIEVHHLAFSADDAMLMAKPPHYVPGVSNIPGVRVWSVSQPKQTLCDLGGKTPYLGGFHPTSRLILHSTYSQDSLHAYRFGQGSCTKDTAKSIVPAMKNSEWRANAYHPGGDFFAALLIRGDGFRLYYYGASDFGLRKEFFQPYNASFEKLIGTRPIALHFNPWDPRYLSASVQLPERAMVWKCE